MLTALVAVPFPITPAEAAGPAASASRDEYGFPTWYEDSSGVRVDTCLDPADTAHCTLLPTPGVYDPLQPLSFPNNFPDEFFYHVAESDRIATPGCVGATNPLAANPGQASVRTAVEGAFANGVPVPGEQMVFARVRVTVRGGLCPNQAYTFIHPYGQTTLTTTEAGSIPSTVGTVDIGCVPTPTSPCNFGQATGSPIFTQGFLRWDPAVNPPADPGYLGGDNTVLHPIVGGINNVFTILDNTSTQLASTNLFTVQGRLAGPLVSSTPKLDFGGQEMATTSNERTITITNVDADPTTIATVASTNPEFTVTPSSSCAAGLVRALDETCDIRVTFSPSTTGLRTGTISIAFTDGTNPRPHSPLTVAVQGTGSNFGEEPTLVVNPTALSFGAVRVGLLSQSQTVTITNTGLAPLQVTNLEFINVPGSFDSQDRQAFRVVNNTCEGVFVPATGTDTCTFGVGFQPLHSHAYAAALKVSANTSGGPVEVTLDATGTGGIAAVSTGPDGLGPDGINPETGFPLWYQDENGVRLGECLDPNDPFCIVLPDDFYTGGAISALPDYDNFPEEYFYYMAESDIIDTPGCGASEPGRAFIRFADEAAFGGGAPLNGDQMVFGRIRLVVTSGLCANTTYHITHPYGEFDVTTDAAGGVRRNAATSDVGCAPLGTFDCNFAEALASPVLGAFLRQVNAPPGYLGDPNIPAPVTGAPYIAVGEIDPANYFRIEQGTDVIGETTQFTVMGKLVGPVMATPPSLSFGVVELLTTSAEQTVTFTNDGIAPVTIPALNSITLTGPTGLPTADYAVTNNGCSNQTLQPLSVNPSSACEVKVTFTPQANGTRVANLFLNHSGLNNPLRVPLSGIGGAAVGEPAISVNPPAASFADLHVGEVSASESIRVSNEGGSAPLIVGLPSISGPGAANFTLVNGCTAPVPVNTDCVIDVAFAPGAAGKHTASLDILSNVTAIPVVSVPLDGRGSTATPLAATTNNAAGFPDYFGDNNGVRLEPCYDPGNPQDPNCVVLGDGGYNPANPLSFPGNFPSEFFYSLVDSEPLTIPSDGACGAGGGDGGTAFLRVALEGTFGTGTPLAGQQIMFARVRINADGLCANTTYEFVHPYGTSTLTSDGEGVIRSTTDVPNVVGSTLLANGFLRWDPNEGPQAPAGYLGDARTFHSVVGSIYRPEGPGTEPVNYFEVVGGSLADVSTDQFLVSGRMAGPVVADKAAIDFGPQAQGSSSANQTVTLRNLAPDAVDSLAASLSGADASDFSLSVPPAGTCGSATSLEQDQTCTVNVAFTPAATSLGAKSATLTIAHSGLGSPITVSLAGTATEVGTPEINLSRTSIAFGNQNVTTTSGPQTVIVTNTGNADLTVNSALLSGAGAPNFTVVNGCAAPVPGAPGPGNTCTITVRFAPLTNGAKSATLTINSDDPIRPAVAVALTGTGVSPVISMTPTGTATAPITLSTGAGGSTSTTINVTNTGTAPLSLIGAPALQFVNQTVTNPVLAPNAPNPLKFTATHNCNNIAAGGKCKITVTFTPGAGTRNQRYAVQLNVLSNASNGTQSAFLRGTRN